MAGAYLPRRRTWIDTSSGSRYLIDPDAMRWERITHDPRSNLLRSEGGRLYYLRGRPRVGRSVVIVAPRIRIDSIARLIMTTPVVCVTTVEPTEPPRPAEGWWD